MRTPRQQKGCHGQVSDRHRTRVLPSMHNACAQQPPAKIADMLDALQPNIECL